MVANKYGWSRVTRVVESMNVVDHYSHHFFKLPSILDALQTSSDIGPPLGSNPIRAVKTCHQELVRINPRCLIVQLQIKLHSNNIINSYFFRHRTPFRLKSNFSKLCNYWSSVDSLFRKGNWNACACITELSCLACLVKWDLRQDRHGHDKNGQYANLRFTQAVKSFDFKLQNHT